MFLLICGLYLLLSLLSEFFLSSDDLAFDYFSEKFPSKRIEDLTEMIQTRKWLARGLIPIVLLKKFFLVAMCFSTGALLYGYESSFKRFFQVAMKAEFIFLIPIILRIIWFTLFKTDYDIIDLRDFSPLSALSLVDKKTLELWYVYPLRLCNAFELIYWLALAIQLKELFGNSLASNIAFVATTYGMGLLVCVLFVVFLAVSVS